MASIFAKFRCIQGKIYVVGGSADGRTLNTFEVQRPASEVDFKLVIGGKRWGMMTDFMMK